MNLAFRGGFAICKIILQHFDFTVDGPFVAFEYPVSKLQGFHTVKESWNRIF